MLEKNVVELERLIQGQQTRKVIDFSAIRQVKILENEITVNSILDKDWILLEITNNGKEVAYHLGFIPGIRKRIDALEGRIQEHIKDC